MTKFKNFLVFFISTALTFLVLELILRTDYFADPELSRTFYGNYGKENYHRTDVPEGYRTTKGIYSSKLVGSRLGVEKIIYDITYTFEKDGVRLTPNNINLPQTAKRVLTIGDSFTLGEGVNDDQTLGNYLSVLGGYFVVNRGGHGYGPHQAYSVLQQELAAGNEYYSIIFQGSPWASSRASCFTDYSVGSPYYEFDKIGPVESGKCDLRRETPNLIGKIKNFSAIFNIIASGFNFAYELERDEVIDRYIKFIIAMAKHHENFIYLHISPRSGWYIGTNWSDKKVLSELVSSGVTIIDGTIADAFGRYKDGYFIPEDNHPTPLAHSYRAALLAKFLKQ